VQLLFKLFHDIFVSDVIRVRLIVSCLKRLHLQPIPIAPADKNICIFIRVGDNFVELLGEKQTSRK